jgi:hypothetical protein
MPRKTKSKGMYANGRSKGNPKHVRHYEWQLSSLAWKSLSMTARCLEIELKSLYNGVNNGDLFLSIREAARRLNIADNTAKNAFCELQEKGFIIPKRKGSFSQKIRHATSWILTEYECNGQLATKNFMRWQPKEKSRTQNLIPSVSKINTAPQNLIPTTPHPVLKLNTIEASKAPMTVANIDTQLIYHEGVNNDT